MDLQPSDWEDLKKARRLFENPSIAIKISDMVGVPIEKGFELLPRQWGQKIGELTRSALMKALDMAIATINSEPGNTPGGKTSDRWHKIAVAATGGIGGFFGLAALAAELPLSTTIMLRSIADVAKSEGEDIHDSNTRMACLEVFALGGGGQEDNSAESGYFAIRAGLARSLTKAAEYVTQKGFVQEGAPALVRLIAQIAERFSIQVSEKAAAQALPALGAAGGALVNTIFISHFQDMARGHFIVRRLERQYGRDTVREAYESL
ncbi:MAG: EcsC family protein [Desulfobacteraceae bacterium]|nr:MAG: EcsC family protein [Desulfobacteraceae bacterium]